MTDTTHYHAGQNTPGYLPDDDPHTFATFADAKASLLHELDRAGDAIFDAGDTPEERGIADEYSAVMEDLNLDSGPEWGTTLPTSTRPFDPGRHFWIVACNEEDCGPEDDDA